MTRISVDKALARGRLQQLATFEAMPHIAETADPQLKAGTGYFVFAPPPQSTGEIQFTEMAYKYGWVLSGFAWQDWIVAERGRTLMENREAIAEATEHELAQVITCLVRSGRFGDDRLPRSLKDGFISALVERAQILLGPGRG